MKINREIILYIINKLGKTLEGRKKLMKLMFLVEHFDTKSKKLTKNKLIGNTFIIYHYGVFSFDVMNDYLELNSKGIIEENPIRSDTEGEISGDIQERVECILSEFGSKHGSDLEVETLKMMGLNKDTKEKFFNKDVKDIIK